MANRRLAIAAGIAKGIESGVQNFQVLSAARQKLKFEEEKLKSDRAYNNARLKNEEINNRIDSEKLLNEREKFRLDESVKKAEIEKKKYDIAKAEREEKRKQDEYKLDVNKEIYKRATELKEADFLQGVVDKPFEYYMGSAAQQIQNDVGEIIRLGKESQTVGAVASDAYVNNRLGAAKGASSRATFSSGLFGASSDIAERLIPSRLGSRQGQGMVDDELQTLIDQYNSAETEDEIAALEKELTQKGVNFE